MTKHSVCFDIYKPQNMVVCVGKTMGSFLVLSFSVIENKLRIVLKITLFKKYP